jgi:hypothetical protein
MLRHAYDKLQSSSHGQATDNVLIECFCLHARNLLDFFRDQKHSNYAVAREFTTASYNPFDGTNPKSSGGLYGKLNDQITHLSYRRTNNPAAKIGPDERAFLKNLIEKEIDNFSNHIDAAYRPLWKVQAEAPVSPRWVRVAQRAHLTLRPLERLALSDSSGTHQTDDSFSLCSVRPRSMPVLTRMTSR